MKSRGKQREFLENRWHEEVHTEKENRRKVDGMDNSIRTHIDIWISHKDMNFLYHTCSLDLLLQSFHFGSHYTQKINLKTNRPFVSILSSSRWRTWAINHSETWWLTTTVYWTPASWRLPCSDYWPRLGSLMALWSAARMDDGWGLTRLT